MRLFRKKMTRAEALAKAIDLSGPGDSVTIHTPECYDPTYCICEPKEVYVGGLTSKNPIGFRMDKNGRQ